MNAVLESAKMMENVEQMRAQFLMEVQTGATAIQILIAHRITIVTLHRVRMAAKKFNTMTNAATITATSAIMEMSITVTTMETTTKKSS